MYKISEFRYGFPSADKILINRHYSVGYSYLAKQPRWALEIIDPRKVDLDRLDNFRKDLRISPKFRADLVDYKGSGYDRGHLVASADQNDELIYNSETFLLSNIAPQKAKFNRIIWRELEQLVRAYNDKDHILETYVISGPIFYFNKKIETIGHKNDNEIILPVPHAFFKSILVENIRGNLELYSYIIPNAEKHPNHLQDYACKTSAIEKLAGLVLWDKLFGIEIENMKNRVLAIKI